MRGIRGAAILALLVWLAACQRNAADPYPTPDVAADRAAYEALMPGPATPFDSGAVPVKHLAAFNFAGIHFRGPIGWWYFNGHLLDQDGKRWSGMFAILGDNQFYGALALPDENVFIPFYRRVATVVERDKLRVSSEGVASLRQLERGRLGFAFQLTDSAAQLDLTLTPQRPPVAIGGEGMITMGDTGRSKYLLIPRLALSGTGTIDGRTVSLRGLGWMDHQWGLWDYRKIDQWNWHSIHLTDGTDLMVFEFVREGKTVKIDCDAVTPAGEHRPGLTCTTERLRRWRSPKTKREWTVIWRIGVPELDAVLTVTADRPDQEINETIYEGGCFVSGTRGGKPVTGRSFYEEYQR